MNDAWISPQELSEGKNNLPAIKITTQNHLRTQRKLKYTKVGKDVMYKVEWVVKYLDSNVREVLMDK